MAKLIKTLVLLGILVVAVVLYVHFSSGAKSTSTGATVDKQKPAAKTDGPPQVQEKYGFAPVGQ
jgi:hypothetical protein